MGNGGWKTRRDLTLDLCPFHLKISRTAKFATGAHLFSSRSKLTEQNWKLQVGCINCLAALLVMPKVLCKWEVLHKDVTVSTFVIGSRKIINDKVNEERKVGFYFIFMWRKTRQIKKSYMVEPYNEILSLRQDHPSNYSSSKDTYLCIICNASLPHFKCFSLLHRGQNTEVIL